MKSIDRENSKAIFTNYFKNYAKMTNDLPRLVGVKVVAYTI